MIGSTTKSCSLFCKTKKELMRTVTDICISPNSNAFLFTFNLKRMHNLVKIRKELSKSIESSRISEGLKL